jgi:hypothetical protein
MFVQIRPCRGDCIRWGDDSERATFCLAYEVRWPRVVSLDHIVQPYQELYRSPAVRNLSNLNLLPSAIVAISSKREMGSLKATGPQACRTAYENFLMSQISNTKDSIEPWITIGLWHTM